MNGKMVINMEKGIVVAGSMVIDYIKEIDNYPSVGLLTNIRSVDKSIGGCVGNTAINLAKIDKNVPIAIIGVIGDDENGKFILSSFRDYGINTSRIIIDKDINTSYTDVMSVIGTWERTFFHVRGANAKFSYEHINFQELQADLFHIGQALLLDILDGPDTEYGTVMAKTLAHAQRAGMKTSIDVASENSLRYSSVITPSLKYCNYVIINEIESGMITGLPVRDESGKLIVGNIQAICEKFMEMGVRDKIVIHAPEASWSLDRDGQFYYMPSLLLPDGYIKGTVGVGDTFCAGMLYAIYKNLDPELSLRIANAAAASRLAQKIAIDGKRDMETLLELDQKFPKRVDEK